NKVVSKKAEKVLLVGSGEQLSAEFEFVALVDLTRSNGVKVILEERFFVLKGFPVEEILSYPLLKSLGLIDMDLWLELGESAEVEEEETEFLEGEISDPALVPPFEIELVSSDIECFPPRRIKSAQKEAIMKMRQGLIRPSCSPVTTSWDYRWTLIEEVIAHKRIQGVTVLPVLAELSAPS
ncbi:hypothetical protein ADUPG1_011335, partial [Aduncisulcus paluster]